MALFSFPVFAQEFCPTSSSSEVILKLAKELEASCDWTIKKMAKEAIIRDCTKAKKKDPSIRFKNEGEERSVHFTQYGHTYDVNEPNVECKHNKAYAARLRHLEQMLEREAYAVSKKPAAPQGKRTSTTSSPPQETKAPKRQLWSCRVPNYIKTFRIVDANEKEILESTYNTVCSPYN